MILTVKQLLATSRERFSVCGVRDRLYFLIIRLTSQQITKQKADTHIA